MASWQPSLFPRPQRAAVALPRPQDSARTPPQEPEPPAQAADEQPQPDRQPGTGAVGTALPGLFTNRLLTERRRTPFSRRGDGVDAPSHTARLATSRGGASPFSSPIQPSLFAVHVSTESNAPAPRGVDDARPADHEQPAQETAKKAVPTSIASGQKGKARDILAAIRTLKQIEQEHRPATAEERQTLQRFGGFGAVALSISTRADPSLRGRRLARLRGRIKAPAGAGGIRERPQNRHHRVLTNGVSF